MSVCALLWVSPRSANTLVPYARSSSTYRWPRCDSTTPIAVPGPGGSPPPRDGRARRAPRPAPCHATRSEETTRENFRNAACWQLAAEHRGRWQWRTPTGRWTERSALVDAQPSPPASSESPRAWPSPHRRERSHTGGWLPQEPAASARPSRRMLHRGAAPLPIQTIEPGLRHQGDGCTGQHLGRETAARNIGINHHILHLSPRRVEVIASMKDSKSSPSSVLPRSSEILLTADTRCCLCKVASGSIRALGKRSSAERWR